MLLITSSAGRPRNGTPVLHKNTPRLTASASLIEGKVTNLRQPPSHIIIVLFIPNRVSEALGLSRNNSECFVIVRISPRTDGKGRDYF